MSRIWFNFLAVFFFTVSQAIIFSRRYTAKLKFDNKRSNSELIGEYKNKSFLECSWICRNECSFFGYNEELKKCRTHRRIYTSQISDVKGWRYYSVDLENLALRKDVSFSSTAPFFPTDPKFVVDGLFGSNNQLFHSNYELHPWLTIALGQIAIVNNVVLYNRNDENGRWLHSVEIRVGMSSVWTEMKICGTFDGPSQTGQIHTIKCEAQSSFNGSYVTVKIVRLNYITDDGNALDGKNALVLQEVVVNGYYA